MSDQRWYHIIATTYGAWLYGDPRGFRTRHHREHVEGDYKAPPPAGQYTDLEERSRASLKRPPVVLTVLQREIVGKAVRDRLIDEGALLVCISMSAQHLHALAKMPIGEARHRMGAAKRHAWFVLHDQRWSGRLWGKRCKALPVRDRAHQLAVYHYILRHRTQGAWVWSMMEDRNKS